MKNLLNLKLIFFCCFVAVISSCKKDDDDQLAMLPSATQSGENTFGALVNGNAFLPDGRYLAFPGSYVCVYDTSTYITPYFVLAVGNQQNAYATRRIILYIDGQHLQEGQNYKLKSYDNGGENYGVYEDIYNTSPTDSYQTDDYLAGEIYISKLDVVKHIVSGTFYFDAKNSKQSNVSVSEGRFDMMYDTQ